MEARISTERHVQRQQKLKEQVDTRVAAAIEKKGILIVFTGNGKGKSTAAFGTVTRAVGHGKTVGVAQYIKGQWDNGEYNLLQPLGVEFHIMGTGFTWETQNRQADIDAAKEVWSESKRMLADKRYDLVVLDELTYMLAYHYLDTEEVIASLQNRPAQQSVIVTGRGCHSQILKMADTVSEIRPVKHAFDNGIQAQPGNNCAWHPARRRFYISCGTTDFTSNHSRNCCKCGESDFSSCHVIIKRLPVRIGTSQGITISPLSKSC